MALLALCLQGLLASRNGADLVDSLALCAGALPREGVGVGALGAVAAAVEDGRRAGLGDGEGGGEADEGECDKGLEAHLVCKW